MSTETKTHCTPPLSEEDLDEIVKKIVDDFPPLTPEQRAEIGGLLRRSRRHES